MLQDLYMSTNLFETESYLINIIKVHIKLYTFVSYINTLSRLTLVKRSGFSTNTSDTGNFTTCVDLF